MDKNKEIIITEELEGLRLDQALSRFLNSRMEALRLIREGNVSIKNIEKIKPSYRLEKGNIVVIKILEIKKPETLEPYDFPISIIYEDEVLLVVEKPAGLVSHPGPGHPQDSLVNALLHKLNLNVGYDSKRPGLLHRLDKEVSGLILLSKTEKAHLFLARQFLHRQIKRKYHGICYGPFLYDEGKIETYIKRHPVHRKKFMISESEGKKSITLFKTLKKGEVSLVEFQLLTGRTHQVRLHSNQFSGGLLGDSVYASSKKIKHLTNSELTNQIQNLKRIALHAVELKFIHPLTQKEVQFKSPFPLELQKIGSLI